MSDRNHLVAPLALAALVGIAGYLVWSADAEVAPTTLERSHVSPPVRHNETAPAPSRSAAVAELPRTAVAMPDPDQVLADWQRDAAAIQQDLIAALLSGDEARIKAAEAQARQLAADPGGRSSDR